jgi:ParB family chromosome partitioning protein
MLISRNDGPRTTEVLDIDPSKIAVNPNQPRKRFAAEELDSLKTSLAREGFLQPLVVRRNGGDAYQLVAGERRLRAAQELGLEAVPALVLNVGEERLLELALVENVQREDLNPIELANGYRQLMQVKGWTQEALAENLSLSRSSVSNTLRLLELPEDMRASIARGHITMGHAKVLLSVADPKEQRILFERIAEEKLTVRDLEEEREGLPQFKDGSRSPGAHKGRQGRSTPVAPHVASLEEQLSERLGTRVRIRERNGRGKLIIEFYSSDDFERIRKLIGGAGPLS